MRMQVRLHTAGAFVVIAIISGVANSEPSRVEQVVALRANRARVYVKCATTTDVCRKAGIDSDECNEFSDRMYGFLIREHLDGSVHGDMAYTPSFQAEDAAIVLDVLCRPAKRGVYAVSIVVSSDLITTGFLVHELSIAK